MNISEAKTIHFVGIGGIGTSALASILQKRGAKISGSDTVPSDLTKAFRNAKIFYKHQASNLPKNCDLVIYSPAIHKDNPELVAARKHKIKTLTYPQALGELSSHYKLIAVAGSHGKSTTTAITSLILEHAGLDPTVVIGTKIREFNGNFRVGKSEYMVVEACEYKRSFINFAPYISIITNVETDHLDYFKDEADYVHAFHELATKTTHAVIIDPTDKNSVKAVKGIKAKVIKLPLKANPRIKPGVIGAFNIKNATFAALAAKELKVPARSYEKTIRDFHGTWRRLEHKKTHLSTPFIDDYAHHPTEIVATLTAIRQAYPRARILCVFQPHQYNRTHHFLKEFGASFGKVDEVIVPNIYEVRDSARDTKQVSTDDLVREIASHGTPASNGGGLKKTAQYLRAHHKEYDLIVTMGAGDIDGIYAYL